ncbi:MAG: hypothetical protein A3J48_02745 [Candidatus Doudnabacteria bacterium RIFCSPHIGHO2_02_FULL_46_11]|uniref:Probable transcriptional regulatory protein A3J48_02745 n=1 Tax=Candidatus Doudnabacteria bacterium RIFCSPHIGHO2_02_FULL_46_11 TaxID=1817832 RepID=A0A1F5P8N2_9BACT|nr:MAG: hypothetical protein A3J48_02745 [Candidatus Doudnabacteria bacterium RIFCSPHIGHO2_02_FULL_46_11]
MSGHNKWSQIKRQKGIADQKKGQVFSKFSKNITLAAKEGGGNSDFNFKLRLLLDRAKSAGMPADNIDRAIKRGTGEGKEAQISAAVYEGLGPAGSAFIVETATDNTNRALQEVRQIFIKNNGQLGNSGSVSWMFDHRGLILATVPRSDLGNKIRSDLYLATIDAGALDVKDQAEGLEIYTEPKYLMKVKEAVENAGAKVESADISWLAKNPIQPTDAEKEKIEKLAEALEENDDVVNVYTNL